MHIIPIISTLRRHRTAAVLIVLEIAFTCAIVCNAIFLITDRLDKMDRPSGLVEDEIVRVRVSGISQNKDGMAVTEQDLAALRAISGVKYAAATNEVPFGQSSWNNGVSTKPDDPLGSVNATMYMGGPDLLETFGTTLIAGRDFTPDEYVDFDKVAEQNVTFGSVIITKALADKLWPSGNALGEKLYMWGKEPQRVVGILDRLARPNEITGPIEREYSTVVPLRVAFNKGGSNYLMRVDPTRKSEVLGAVDAALTKIDPNRIIRDGQPFAEVRANYFKTDRAMAWLLAGVSIALLVITALGVVGLASFWVQQRTRQIGIRRALGATKMDILRYFQMENFILATLGIIVGMGMAYGINLVLMDRYHVARLPASFLPIGAFLLWVLGQIAVFGPALRASMIPPAIATRTV
jgi:putative ABC transport system permease protein